MQQGNPQAPGQQPSSAAPSAMPSQGAEGQTQQVDPAIAQHLDPNNQVQMFLLQRIGILTEQEAATFAAATQPPAIAILKKVFPEIAFIFDQIDGGQGGMPGGMQMGGAQQGAMQGQQMPGGPRPQTRLGGI